MINDDDDFLNGEMPNEIGDQIFGVVVVILIFSILALILHVFKNNS